MKSLSASIIGSAVVGVLAFSGTAFAQTTNTAPQPQGSARSGGMWGGGAGKAPGVVGTVSAVSGTTLTVTSKGLGKSTTATATTYTVDASNATVTKAGAASSASAIAVGDTVMVQGTVSGTSVTATSIRDGVGGTGKAPTPVITGNGEPVVGGAVTAVSGTTLTVTNKSNVTYTIDASSATVEKGNVTSSISNVAVGDNVVVQGTVNGTSVTASSVIDSGTASASGNSTGGAGGMMHGGGVGGVFGAIGGFFQHLFGFF